MRLITNLFLWSPVLTFLFFKGIPGDEKPFHVGHYFKKRHIRRGDCYWIHMNGLQRFKENLNKTAWDWPQFKVKRTCNTFILSRNKTVEEIAQCITRLVKGNPWGERGKYDNTTNVNVKMNEFKTTCGFKDIQLAVIKGIRWKNGDVDFNSCECGEADFTVSYNTTNNKIQHFDYQQDWPEDGIPGEDNPFHVGYKFEKRHIRQGDCNGIYMNGRQSFRENLEKTARDWPEFKVNRQRNTFILSRHKSDEEIAECISRLVYVNGPGRQGSFQATMDVDVKIQEFKTTCKFPDIQLAVINKIEWKNENVFFFLRMWRSKLHCVVL